MGKETNYNGLPMPQRVWAVVVVTTAVVMAVLDMTVVNLALPTMNDQLHVMEADSIWILNAYQLVIIMTMLSMSRIGEITSYKRIYIIGMVVFTLSSWLCGISCNFTMLVIGRALQGIGAAAVMSINTTMLRLSYPREWLGKGMGINATVVALATVIGPSLAALILTMLTWRWIFFINIPLGIFAIIVGIKSLPDNIEGQTKRALSYTDVLMSAIFFGSIMMVVEGFSHQFPKWLIIIFGIAVLLVGYIFIKREYSTEYPLLPVDLLRIPVFSLSVLTSIASFASQTLMFVALPFFLENTMGMDAGDTGMIFSAWPLSIIVVAPIVGMLIGKVDSGVMCSIGLALMGIGIVLLVLYNPSSADAISKADIIWRLALCGIGFGMFQTPNNTLLIASAPQKRMGSASGMQAMARLIGQTLGATLVALSFSLFPVNAITISFFFAIAIAFIASGISVIRLHHQAQQ